MCNIKWDKWDTQCTSLILSDYYINILIFITSVNKLMIIIFIIRKNTRNILVANIYISIHEANVQNCICQTTKLYT